MAQLVAKSDGNSYSIFLRKEKKWRTIVDKKKEEYTPPSAYVPHHLKNLKKGLKLFLIETWPAFKRETSYTKDVIHKQFKK